MSIVFRKFFLFRVGKH